MSQKKLRARIWGINYSPELTGIAPYNTALAEFLVERGHDVHVVSTFTYYPAWKKLPTEKWTLFRTDDLEGVTVHRCWHYVPAAVTSLKRILHEGSFVVTSFLRQLLLRRPDVFIVVSPPLLLGAAAWFLSLFKRAPVLFHVQDLQPDAAAGLGMLKNRGLIRALYALEKFAYRKSACVSGISGGMLHAFERKGVPESKRLYFPNGVALANPATFPKRGNFRLANGILPDDFLAVYSGNLGAKQGLEILIEAARLLKNPNIRIVICGEGSQRPVLEACLAKYSLTQVSLLPLQPEMHYREMLVDADLCFITQQRGSGNFFFPSKLLTTLAFGKAVLTVADLESELSLAVGEGEFGVNVLPEQPQALADALEKLAGDRALLARMGEAGRRYVARFEMRSVLEQFEKFLLRFSR
jgi:colanic acid biosynthesis glycosyl transferase WcaI